MNCTTFQERIAGFLGDEMAVDERARHQAHLDACPGCAERLEAERSFEHALRGRLPRVPAPPGLETRVRAAIRSESTLNGGPAVPWWRNAWLATAASAALAVVLLLAGPVPTFDGTPASATFRGRVVDLNCDAHGLTIEHQRDCHDASHHNALRLENGEVVRLAVDDPARHGSLLANAARGLQVEVSGRYFRATGTVAVADVHGL